MSAWNRNQTTSFRPPNMAPFRNNNGGSTHGSSQATVPDISIRNHRQWKSAFERVLAEYLTRGTHGADQLNAIVKQAINDRLNAEPDSQTFKSLQLVTDVITALSIGSYLLSLSLDLHRELVLTHTRPRQRQGAPRPRCVCQVRGHSRTARQPDQSRFRPHLHPRHLPSLPR